MDDEHGTDAKRGPRWRLSFPADGSAVFELTTALDASATRALAARIAELAAHERLGLVIDLTAAGVLDDEQLTQLLVVYGELTGPLATDGCTPSPVVVVTPSADALARRFANAGVPSHILPVATPAGVRPALRAAAPAAAARPLIDGDGDDLGARCRRAIERALAS
ncbi:hypothetical protein [Conexibacter woesei]|uniref:STAS domain-containing protein n=1 Tax=Conexibacter woesei (strain DSM 14684 / CCUG 47730 / CIP 108061 / JCM 11494 / NBRC 100937 / ID131577) TaxID=469383 RepID=D3FEQ7_CONWI|nr:hypothetical protein [Conexibacter woesei]ADB49731.1 hypothetical protein Cwoe_1302 [Conexibacter woesei DSM 14684]